MFASYPGGVGLALVRKLTLNQGFGSRETGLSEPLSPALGRFPLPLRVFPTFSSLLLALLIFLQPNYVRAVSIQYEQL